MSERPERPHHSRERGGRVQNVSGDLRVFGPCVPDAGRHGRADRGRKGGRGAGGSGIARFLVADAGKRRGRIGDMKAGLVPVSKIEQIGRIVDEDPVAGGFVGHPI
jgi:hypothetical protein